MRKMLMPALVVCVLTGAGCTGPDAAPAETTGKVVSTATAEAEVAKRMDGYVNVLRADQGAAIADYWSEDAQIAEPETEFHNRAEFMAAADELLKTIRIKEIELKSLHTFAHDDGTVAYQYGSVTEVLEQRDGSGTPTTMKINFAARWVKQAGGVWRMDHFMETPMPKETKQ